MKNEQSNLLVIENKKLKNELKRAINANNIILEKDLILQLYHTIEELKQKLGRYPCGLAEGESLISVIFTSSDQKIHQSIICKNTEKFSRLEETLYEKFPEYSDTSNFFYVKDKTVSRFKSLKENNINDSEIILLKKIEKEKIEN